MKRFALRIERSVVGAMFVGYCAWNAYWLLHLRIPPSIFLAITGLPCPTTGGTRSMRCLFRGDWMESLRYNAMTLPIAMLFIVSLAWLARCALTRRPLLLHRSFPWLWGIFLAVAWALKLLGDRRYW